MRQALMEHIQPQPCACTYALVGGTHKVQGYPLSLPNKVYTVSLTATQGQSGPYD